MSRLLRVALPALLVAFGALGCERRDPLDPHEFVAEETARVARASRGAVRTDGEADIVVASAPDEPSEAPGMPLRHTVSLGFAGDGELTQIPPRGDYDDGGYAYAPMPYYAPAPYYGSGGRVSHRFRGGFAGGGAHGSFHGGGAHGSFHGGSAHGSFGGGGSHGGHGGHGGGGHGGHGGR